MKPRLIAILFVTAALLVLVGKSLVDSSHRTELSEPDKPRMKRERIESAQAAPEPVVIDPRKLGLRTPTSKVDHPARITALIESEDMEALHWAVAAWFREDPGAVRDWLGMQESLEPLEPAIAAISLGIAEQGDVRTALQWAKLLPRTPRNEDALFGIYALGARNGGLTREQIESAELPAERIDELLSGAAGD